MYRYFASDFKSNRRFQIQKVLVVNCSVRRGSLCNNVVCSFPSFDLLREKNLAPTFNFFEFLLTTHGSGFTTLRGYQIKNWRVVLLIKFLENIFFAFVLTVQAEDGTEFRSRFWLAKRPAPQHWPIQCCGSRPFFIRIPTFKKSGSRTLQF